MIKLVLTLDCILLVYSFFHLLRYFVFIVSINRKKIESTEKNYDLIVVIPCFKEQKVIEKTIEYFNSIIKKNISLVLVTTNKEKGLNTTKDIIERNIITKYPNTFLINYPYGDGMMADQLNYVLKNINQYIPKAYVDNKTYFCVYNADSRPNRNTFKELDKKIVNNFFPEFIQQYSYALSNYDQLDAILKGFAIYQSNFELKCGMLNSYFDSYLLHRHLVGHGLFVRLDVIKKINGFNTKFWCEDIYMSAVANNLNYKIEPMLCLENMETPNKIIKLVKQNAVWFETSNSHIKLYIDVFKSQKKISIRGILGLVNEFRSSINWLFFPFIIVFLFVSSIFLGVKYFIFSLIAYISYILIYSYTTIQIINKLENKKIKYNMKMFISTFIATLISNIGPLYFLITKPKEKYKTER